MFFSYIFKICFYGYVISFDSFFSERAAISFDSFFDFSASHWWSIAQRVVSGASDLSASTDLFHGYGNMKDLQDRTDYHFICFLLVFILHRPGRDIIQGRCELSCMWWFVPLL